LGESNSTWDGKDDILVDGALCSFQGIPY
jgi:hypothetical protein